LQYNCYYRCGKILSAACTGDHFFSHFLSMVEILVAFRK